MTNFGITSLGKQGKAWLTIIVVTPLVMVTSYELYQRIINGKQQKVLNEHDKFQIVREPKK
ncbi:hypothetical protein K502DRAFT_362999 [Neoconidiobolus thromboides FSU 785]|nr:hypothetical protein K502DRAFT_362999 [Neoconidiobolus thromboides FSU 785]